MSAPIRLADRKEVGECETQIQCATDRRDEDCPAFFFLKIVVIWTGFWFER